MGLSLSVTCAAESLVFYYLPAIMAIGIKRCMHLVILAFLVRMGWYTWLAYAPTPWLVSSGVRALRAALRSRAGASSVKQPVRARRAHHHGQVPV